METVVTGFDAPQKSDKKTKEDRMKDFIKSVVSIENAMEPYKEQRKDLRKEYIENQWLSKEEMRAVVKAYRLVKDETDFDELERVYNTIKK